MELYRKIPEIDQEHDLNDWQKWMDGTLDNDPDDREIMFVVDEEGGKGKTWFAKRYCRRHKDAQMIEPGKKADMAYALDEGIRVLFLNLTRQQCEHLQYSFLEAVKDGMVFSPKYESRMKYMQQKVHVVVMMNQQPDMTMLSQDRYNIWNINN